MGLLWFFCKKSDIVYMTLVLDEEKNVLPTLIGKWENRRDFLP